MAADLNQHIAKAGADYLQSLLEPAFGRDCPISEINIADSPRTLAPTESESG